MVVHPFPRRKAGTEQKAENPESYSVENWELRKQNAEHPLSPGSMGSSKAISSFVQPTEVQVEAWMEEYRAQPSLPTATDEARDCYYEDAAVEWIAP
jgi:hypothetical protein